MTRLAVKKAVVYTALLLLTVWPAIHLYLVERYELSAWKLGGWGMYSVPRPKVFGMNVFGRAAGGELTRLTDPTPALQTEAEAYLERFRWLRLLVVPDAFADLVFAARPEWDELRIEVSRSRLDPRTGMIGLETEVHAYRR